MAQGNGPHGLLIGEEVASTAPHTSRRLAPRAASRVAPPCAAERASVAQLVPAPSGPLMAARELLHNPLERRHRQTCTGNGVKTSTVSSTWHRLPQALRGGLFPGSTVARAAHPVPCTHRP
jgi:hypothetical protein